MSALPCYYSTVCFTILGGTSTRGLREASYGCFELGERFLSSLLFGLAKTPVWVARSNMARVCSGLTIQLVVKGLTEVCVRAVPGCPFVGEAISTAVVTSANAPVSEIWPDELMLGKKAATRVLSPMSIPPCATVVILPLLYKYAPTSPVDVIP